VTFFEGAQADFLVIAGGGAGGSYDGGGGVQEVIAHLPELQVVAQAQNLNLD
jgi:hypothetical protein